MPVSYTHLERGCHQQSGFRGAAASGTAGTAKLPVIPADSGRRISRTEDLDVYKRQGLAYTPSFLQAFAIESINGTLWALMVEIQLYVLVAVVWKRCLAWKDVYKRQAPAQKARGG